MATKIKHGCGFEIIERGPDNSWQTWLASCKCGAKWTGSSYEAVEDKWRQHVHVETGIAPDPMGAQVARWSA